MKSYKASIIKARDRQVYTIMYRHPVYMDKSGKYGKKVHKSLKTSDKIEAEKICKDANTLLKHPKWWDSNNIETAKDKFHPRAIEVFYIELGNEDWNSLLSNEVEKLREENKVLKTRIALLEKQLKESGGDNTSD